MLSLPLITPRDSHELWFGSPQPYRTQSQQNQPVSDANQSQARRNAHNTPNTRAIIPSSTLTNSLSALQQEERALRARKQNIASFGYSWIKPAGCPKTMLGMKEEEAEREEALAAAAAEMATAAAAGDAEEFGSPQGADGQDDSAMERDLDDDIPDADAEGLVEEGEEALEEEDVVDEESYMERDLDDDIPEAFDDAQEEDQDDFDNMPDLDDEVPAARDDDMSDGMAYDLDDEVPEAEEGEWQHTDTEAELDDDEEEDSLHDPFGANFRASTSSGRGPPLPPIRRENETEAQRRFLQRWSGGGDAFDSSMMADDNDLRASIASRSSRPSGFGRFSRRRSRPRDSFN